MTPTERIAVLVDAYSSGALFASELRGRNIACVHVQSQPEIPLPFAGSFRPEDFTASFVFRGDIDALIAELSQYPIVFVATGTETGVALVDALTERLCLPTNGTALSNARRDKYLMTEIVRRGGLMTARQLRAQDLPSILQWVREEAGLPIVLKPTCSAGSDSVSLCNSELEVRSAFDKLMQARNQLDVKNEALLGQEVLQGTEYVIDTVSADGRHHVTDIWRYEKKPTNGAPFVYHSAEILPSTGEEQGQLVDYTRKVLDALQIKYGPAHSEVILTPRGPALVETAARPHGGNAPVICRACIGYSQIDLVVDAYLAPSRFLSVASEPYPLEKHCTLVFLISSEEGTLRALPRLDEIRKLESFHELHMRARVGAPVKKTVDLFSSPGIVSLMSADKSAVDRDYRRIRDLEKDGFYVVELIA